MILHQDSLLYMVPIINNFNTINKNFLIIKFTFKVFFKWTSGHFFNQSNIFLALSPAPTISSSLWGLYLSTHKSWEGVVLCEEEDDDDDEDEVVVVVVFVFLNEVDFTNLETGAIEFDRFGAGIFSSSSTFELSFSITLIDSVFLILDIEDWIRTNKSFSVRIGS